MSSSISINTIKIQDITILAKEIHTWHQEDSSAAKRIESYIFVTTNELNQQRSLSVLKKHTFSTGHCHVGVSGLFNWKIASVTSPEVMLMVDLNPKMVKFNKLAIEKLKSSETPQEFVFSLADACLDETQNTYTDYYATSLSENGVPDLNTIYIQSPLTFIDDPKDASGSCVCNRNAKNDQEFKEIFEGAFLGYQGIFQSCDSFSVLKKMAAENRIIAFQGDLTDGELIKRVGAMIREKGLHFGTIYPSNAYEWIKGYTPEKTETFLESIAQLAEPNSLIIEGISDPTRQDEGCFDIQQNIFYYQDPYSKELYHPGRVRSLNTSGVFEEDEALRQKRYPSAPLLTKVSSSDIDQ